MKLRFSTLLLSTAILIAGCATPPQTPIAFSQASVAAESGRIGVAMTTLPKLDTEVPGAGCLLCLAVATQANAELTTYAQTLGYEDLSKLKDEVAVLLRKNGANVVVIDERVTVSALPDYSSDATSNLAPKSYAMFKQKHQIDKLLILDIKALGFIRTYSGYIPTSDPKALFRAVGYMVDLSNNRYAWYDAFEVTKSSEHKWDDPPRFPGMTNAYFQVLEMGKDRLVKPLLSSGDSVKTTSESVAPKIATSTLASVNPAKANASVAVLVAAGSPSTQTALPAAAAQSRLLPMAVNTGRRPKTGDEWEYVAHDKLFGKHKTLLWRVKDVNSSGILEELLVDGIPTTQRLFGNKPDLIGAPIDTGFLFGQSWDTQSSLRLLSVSGLGDCVQRLNCTVDAKVVGYEQITIAAGTFNAVRIDGQLRIHPFTIPFYGTISFWYSEKDRRLLKQVAKLRAQSQGVNLDESVELQVARALQ